MDKARILRRGIFQAAIFWSAVRVTLMFGRKRETPPLPNPKVIFVWVCPSVYFLCVCVWVSCGCWNVQPYVYWHKATEMHSFQERILTLLKGPRAFFCRGSGENLSVSLLSLGGCNLLQLEATSFQSHLGILLPLSECLIPNPPPWDRWPIHCFVISPV